MKKVFGLQHLTGGRKGREDKERSQGPCHGPPTPMNKVKSSYNETCGKSGAWVSKEGKPGGKN